MTTTTTTTTTTEPYIGEWTSWSDYDARAERGSGPFKKLRHRSAFHSAACKREGCAYKGPQGFLGTGKFSIKVNQT